MKNPVKDALFGIAVADALGVPVEFESREKLGANPVFNMRGYGTYNQPPGTWSDDSSLTFCLADSLLGGYSLPDMAKKFVGWRDNAEWTAHNEVFDIGNTTHQAISLLRDILNEPLAQELLESLITTGNVRSNGNGSLMRIMPLLFFIKTKPPKERFRITKEAVALTHPHERGAMACHIYLTFAAYLLENPDKDLAYERTQDEIKELFKTDIIDKTEHIHFDKVINNNIAYYDEMKIVSDGYVINSLNAALWCVMRERDYQSTVLQAVNLGFDTDTTAAIAGGLAGLIYGFEKIPQSWVSQLAKKDEIEALCEKLNKKYS